MFTRTRLVPVVMLVLLFGYSGYVAVHRGLAALYAIPGESSLTLWREGERRLRQSDWRWVQTSLEKSLSYDERNPDLLHELGEVYDGEVAFYPMGYAGADDLRNKARQQYLQALAVRPVWPHDWVALTLVKYRLNQVDAGFHHALHQSLTLGPWEPSVKYVIADIGLHHWDGFDNDMRQLVKEVIHDGVQDPDSATAMLNLVRRYDMPELVCTGDIDTDQVRAYCAHYQRH